MPHPVRPCHFFRVRNRSYSAAVRTPEPPIFEWLADLDAWISRSAGFLIGKPVVLDLAAVTLSKAAVAHLLGELQTRNIRIMGFDGIGSERGPELPPLLTGGAGAVAVASPPPPEKAPVTAPSQQEPASLLMESAMRLGQSIVFTRGDVTVIGSVGSGAEIVAGGSIHVDGTLRGRAMAGVRGNPRARIFCNRIEAELLAIDGSYMTVEEIDSTLRQRPAQAWLEGDVMKITALN